MRALAIVAVMFFHLRGFLSDSIRDIDRNGWMGVDLFFVLSGYLIGSQLLKPYLSGRKPSLMDFYRRRAFRILPAYLVVLLLYVAWPAWREEPGLSPLWQFLTFTENLFVDYSVNQAFSHAWSLCVEEHFYLVLPLLVLWLMRKPSLRKTVLLLASLVVFGMAIRGFVLFHQLRKLGPDDVGVAFIEHIYYPTYTRLDGLMVGVSLALIKAFRPQWWAAMARRGHATMLAGVVLIGVSLWLFVDRMGVTTVGAWGTIVGFPLLSLGLGFLVASSVSSNGVLSRFRIPGARWLATLAFSLYLTHKEIVHLDRLYMPSLEDDHGVKAMLIYAASCVGAAAVLYFAVERPFMLLRDRLDPSRALPIAQEILSEPAL